MRCKDGFDFSLKNQEAEKLSGLTVCHSRFKVTCRQVLPILFTHQNQQPDFQNCTLDGWITLGIYQLERFETLSPHFWVA